MVEIKGARILVIEDQPIIAMAMTDALTEMGAVVAGQASNFREALRLASEAEADAVLLDIWLKDVAAYTIGDILTQRGIPFIIVSGAAKSEEPALCRNAPRLLKPFKEDELLAALTRLLREHPVGGFGPVEPGGPEGT